MRGLLIILACLIIPVSVFSQEKKVALVIGNSNYENGAPLANPENDAEDISEKLNEAGFDVSRYIDLNQSEMKKAIDEFGFKLDKADVGLFFYAGHGVQAKGRNYLLPVDAALRTENDVEYNCVDAGRILAKMGMPIPALILLYLMHAGTTPLSVVGAVIQKVTDLLIWMHPVVH